MTTRSPMRTNTNANTAHTHSNPITTDNTLNTNLINSNNGLQQLDLDICATSVKLLQFWTNCPEAWFVHVEMQFATKGITTDQTKYEYIITALPQEVIIKDILIERHSLSETSKLDKVLSDSDIGDRKPSEFYRFLALLAGSNFSTDILIKLWLRKIPKPLNITLTGSNINDPNELIQLADRLWEVIYNKEVCSVKQSSHNNNEEVVKNLTISLCENRIRQSEFLPFLQEV